jgi:hypothetical protein
MATLDPGDEGFSTQCVWGGDPESSPDGATVPPIYHTVTFEYDDLDTWQAVGAGDEPGHIYSRNTNPTVEAFEKKMRALEGAEAATSFATWSCPPRSGPPRAFRNPSFGIRPALKMRRTSLRTSGVDSNGSRRTWRGPGPNPEP